MALFETIFGMIFTVIERIFFRPFLKSPFFTPWMKTEIVKEKNVIIFCTGNEKYSGVVFLFPFSFFRAYKLNVYFKKRIQIQIHFFFLTNKQILLRHNQTQFHLWSFAKNFHFHTQNKITLKTLPNGHYNNIILWILYTEVLHCMFDRQ